MRWQRGYLLAGIVVSLAGLALQVALLAANVLWNTQLPVSWLAAGCCLAGWIGSALSLRALEAEQKLFRGGFPSKRSR
jgi:hypothetical protein